MRIDLYLEKYDNNLPRLTQMHEYLTLKMKEFPELFSTVT